MPRYRHPRNIGVDDPAQFAVDLGGDHVTLDPDGTFEHDAESDVRALAAAHGYEVSDLRVDDAGDGCPHCDDYDGDHLAQHIAQAHPEVDE